jgi:MEMO1 family protein
MSVHRKPIAAGTFYPDASRDLTLVLERLCPFVPSQTKLNSSVGLIAPHAGYVYSGSVAGKAFSLLASMGTPEWAIILGSNHTGMGYPISTVIDQTWETPLGTSTVSSEIAQQIITGGARVAPEAFLHEHSIEVQLPFIQHLFGLDIPFVPICIMLPPLEDIIALGEVIAGVSKETTGVVVASSDFTHYQPSHIAHRLDHQAIEHIVALDLDGFYHKLISERLTICGAGAIAALMSCARRLDWKGELISYTTSGDITGDQTAVVGYAAISFIGGKDDK